MQDAELLAKHPSDNQQRFDQNRQVGQVLDKLSAIQTTPNRQRGDIRAIPKPVKLAPLKDRTR